jgi:hypothetical protein
MSIMKSFIVSIALFVGANSVAIGQKHESTLPLETGTWNQDYTFDVEQVVTDADFELAGCGLDLTWQLGAGGGSDWSADPGFLYTYDVGADGCIVPGGSSTYTAPSKPGWYSIDFYAWDDVPPYGPIPEGTVWIHVKKANPSTRVAASVPEPSLLMMMLPILCLVRFIRQS